MTVSTPKSWKARMFAGLAVAVIVTVGVAGVATAKPTIGPKKGYMSYTCTKYVSIFGGGVPAPQSLADRVYKTQNLHYKFYNGGNATQNYWVDRNMRLIYVPTDGVNVNQLPSWFNFQSKVSIPHHTELNVQLIAKAKTSWSQKDSCVTTVHWAASGWGR